MLLQILLAACGQGLSTAALQLPVPFLDQLLIAAVGWRLRWLLLLSELQGEKAQAVLAACNSLGLLPWG